MRRISCAVLMMLLLLLSACGGGETDQLKTPMEFRTVLLQAEQCSFTAEMKLDLQDRLYSVTLDCVCFANGSAELTVRAPETIEGICAHMTDCGSGELRFDGAALDFGLTDTRLPAPVAIPALMTAYWKSAYVAAAGAEDGLLRVSYEDDLDDRDLRLDTWFDAGELPVYAELCSGSEVIAELTLTNFLYNGGTP